MNVVPIAPNPYYPLPPDYPSLSEEGQRLARVNAMRQWLLPGTPAERAARKIASYKFLDAYYLLPDPSDNFDPGFYDDVPLPSPEYHFLMVGYAAMYNKSLFIAPRGGAKTAVGRKESILELLTRPKWSIVYASSSIPNASSTSQAVRDQFIQNSRINDDFAAEPEFAGRLIPRRGLKPFGAVEFYLNNGAYFRSVSATSKVRGIRPFVYSLDDPEYDPSASTSMDVLRSYVDRLVFKVAMPAVARAGASIRWRGTFVSRRHYLYHAWMTDAKGAAADDRFDNWARLFIPAAYEHEGKILSCWPHRGPADADERIALNLPADAPTLKQLEKDLGKANFMSEMMGRPGEADDGFFPNLQDTRCFEPYAYWYEGIDDAFTTTPHSSSTLICWHHNGEVQRVPLKEFLARARLFATVDSAYTENTDSDDKVVVLQAFLPHNNLLFTLDGWASNEFKVPELIKQSLNLCVKWRCPVIHVETVKQSLVVYSTFQSVLQTRAAEMVTGQTTFLPSVVKLKPTTERKEDRIVAALQFRFDNALIKVPFNPTTRLPIRSNAGNAIWGKLHIQISEFNPAVDGGGLKHDDVIDAVAMSMGIIRGKNLRQRVLSSTSTDPADIKARILAGEKEDAHGIPLYQYLKPGDLTTHDILSIENNDASNHTNRI